MRLRLNNKVILEFHIPDKIAEIEELLRFVDEQLLPENNIR